MQLVEFMGLPGSGKSTLAREIANTLRRRGLGVSEPIARINEMGGARRSLAKLAYCASASLASPAATASLAQVVAASGQPNAALAAKNLTNLVLQRGLALFAPKQGVVLHDQGVFQALWSLSLEARTPPRLDTALYERIAHTARRRLVVLLDADVIRVLERLSARSDSGRFAQSADATPATSSLSVELLEQLFRYAKRLSEHQAGVRVARIDNRGARLEEALEATLRAVSEFLA
ncbi:MAG: AAA family ATPase [Myxococcota bacterium]|nr:AAA family ATPase [Myxococcota bacterium]